MTKYWSISITIPGKYFTQEAFGAETGQSIAESGAVKLTQIDVEEITSHVFNLEDDSQEN